ncbi:MAG: hypothetical protein C5B54_11010 [Acidobacteria bacterium]|nr:MAG: hypothetical protein C5B54_11010 [Acidobacteriota bacterium]
MPNFVTSWAPGNVRDSQLWVGVGFRLLQDIVVSSLGCWVLPSNAGMREIVLGNASEVLASAMVNLSSVAPNNFAYINIAPVKLSAGTVYFVLANCIDGSDWSNNNAFIVHDSGMFDQVAAAFDNIPSVNWPGAFGEMYVGVDFVYDLPLTGQMVAIERTDRASFTDIEAAVKLFNLVRVLTPTTGTGTLMLGAPVQSFLSFEQAGAQDKDRITYSIDDVLNSIGQREIGRGVYSTTGPTLTRKVLSSTNGNNPLNLSGNAQVSITAAAEDFIKPAIEVDYIVVSDIAPAGPTENQLWFNSIDGQLYIWFNDGTTLQWVATSSGWL